MDGYLTLVPPLFSLFMSSLVHFHYEIHFRGQVQRFLQDEGHGDVFVAVDGILKRRSLQIAYLAALPASIVSWFVTAQLQPTRLSSVLLWGVGGAFLLIVILPFLSVFGGANPTREATRIVAPKSPWPFRLLANRGTTYFTLHTVLLNLINSFLVAATVYALVQTPKG